MRKINSLRVQLVAFLLACYLVPTLVLGVYMGTVFFQGLREKAEAALTTGAEYAYTMSLENVDRALTLAKDATYDNELTTVYAGYASGELRSADFLTQSRNYIERKYGRESLFTVAVFVPVQQSDMLIYGRAGYEQAMAFEQTLLADVLKIGETLDTRCLFLQSDDGTVYLIRNLMNLRMERFGMLVLGIQMDRLLAPVTEFAQGWDARVTVQLGQAGATETAWADMETGLLRSESPSDVLYVQKAHAWDYDFNLCLSIARDRVYGEIRAFRRLMIGLLLLLVPVIVLILWYVHRRIVKPITLLSDASRRIEAGELGVTVPMHGGDELGDLGRAFSNMSTQIATLIDKTYKEEIALRDARIQAMQSRINPHFVNNALETLNWEARIEGSEKMSAMVESLSVLLNASMSRKNKRMVTLGEENEIAQAYFYFVGLRFGDRLRVSTRMDERALHCAVPQLTIQPLLENAVEHGIAPADGGEIQLSCDLDGATLRLDVINSGKPIQPEDRARIEQALQGEGQSGTHLGLSNIANRLRLIYGDQASITVLSDELNRTVVHLQLPYTTLSEEERE